MKVELDVSGFTNGKVPTAEAWSVALYAAGLLTGTSQVRVISADASPGEGWRWVEPGEKTIDGDEKANSGPVSEPGEPVTERLVFRRRIANLKDLEFDVFLLRRQLAACKRAAQANTRDSAEHVKRDITGVYATEAFQAVCHAVQREMNHREARSPLTPDQAKVVSTAAVGMRTAAAVTKSDLSREILNRQADVLESIEFGGLADEDRRAISFALKAIRGQATAALNLSEICNRLEKLAGGGSNAST